jgi:O-antigen ligase
MDEASEPSTRAPGAGALVLTGLVGAVLAGAVFAGDGSDAGGVLPVGGAAVLLLAGAFVGMGAGWLAAPRIGATGALLVGATLALTVWTGLTMAWSIAPDRSWDSFNKALAYAAFLGLGIVLSAAGGRAAARIGASLLALVIGAALAWALLTKAIPSLDPEGDRVARLREPVGYWNGLALLADMALALGLWLGTTRGHRLGVRVSGALLVYVATLSLMLTLSRAGVVVGAAVLVFWLALSRERLDSALLFFAAALPAGLVGAWAFTRPALTEDAASRSDRVADGTVFGVLVLVGGAVVALLVAVGSRRTLADDTRRRIGRWLAVSAALCAVAGVVGLGVASADAISRDRDCAEVENDPRRLGTVASARLCWWGEALDVFAGHSPEGAGAGTFEIARKRYRADARSVVEPHNVPLQHLSDGGIAGLTLFVVLVAAATAVCIGALRRLDGPERAAAVALVAAPAAYLGHALVDYDWNFLALTAPTMVALGVLAGAGREAGARRRRPLFAVMSVLVAALTVVSFAFPHLADRMERSSTRALGTGDFDRARDQALWARFFNPLAVEPLFALARVEEVRGVAHKAEARYIQAVELQPENPEAWYALGLFEFEALENLCATYRFLNNAYTLDPSGNQWRPGGPLDLARDAVNEGGCAPGS